MKTATKLRLVSSGPKRSFIELTDSGRAIAAAQHRAGREPSHLTVSQPYGRPSHIAVTNTRMISTVTRKPPHARGHRAFLFISKGESNGR